MKESILHYIWQHKLFVAHNLLTTDNEKVEVIDVGKYNTDAGPDFFNAKIKIGNTLWAGNIEIHLQSSDWNRHNHQNDTSYDSVILHVVKQADKNIFRKDGAKIPQLILKYPDYIKKNYDELIHNQKWIPCESKINTVPSIFIQGWKNALLTERLSQKMDAIQQLLAANNQHWEEAFYITLGRNFGFNTNSQAFETLVKSISITILGKHKDNQLQIEALLFGQSGLLPENSVDEYVHQLKTEYNFLRSKYSLQPLEKSQWKLLRLRPENFPHIRIAQFASLIHSSSKLFSKMVEKPEIGYLKSLFSCEPSTYWITHFTFEHESERKNKKIGALSVNGILINTIVPFLFCYAALKNIQDLKDTAIQLLENIPAEKNSIINGWKDLGIISETAYDSQALLQLKKHYCDDKNCLRCRIGHKVMTISN